MEIIRAIPSWVPFPIEQVSASVSWDRTFPRQVKRSDTRRSERAAFVPFKCVNCGAPKDLEVGKLKSRIRQGTFTGTCRACCRKIRMGLSTGSRHARWMGGRKLDRAGYVRLHVDGLTDEDRKVVVAGKDGYVMEHRLVMGRRLGRPLEAWEKVPHRKGDRADNRADNLQVCCVGKEPPHPPGQTVEDLVHWARQIEAMYGHLLPKGAP